MFIILLRWFVRAGRRRGASCPPAIKAVVAAPAAYACQARPKAAVCARGAQAAAKPLEEEERRRKADVLFC
jgi:hypothetical protein